MTLSQWLGVGSLGLIVAFAIFAFRQGTKVDPDGTGNSDRGLTPPD